MHTDTHTNIATNILNWRRGRYSERERKNKLLLVHTPIFLLGLKITFVIPLNINITTNLLVSLKLQLNQKSKYIKKKSGQAIIFSHIPYNEPIVWFSLGYI